MIRTILIQGKSGAGKSTSLRNLDPSKTYIIKPNNKNLPFPGADEDYQVGKNVIETKDLKSLESLIKGIATKKADVEGVTIVVEDFTHFMNARTLSPSFYNNKDWGKWGSFGGEVYAAIAGAAQELKHPDLTIVLIGHVEAKDDGTINIKTSGKLLDREVDIPSYFTVQLYAHILNTPNGRKHLFMTNSDGLIEAKSPMYMFSKLNVPNDLNAIIERVKAYGMLPKEVKRDYEKLQAWAAEQDVKDFGSELANID